MYIIINAELEFLKSSAVSKLKPDTVKKMCLYNLDTL